MYTCIYLCIAYMCVHTHMCTCKKTWWYTCTYEYMQGHMFAAPGLLHVFVGTTLSPSVCLFPGDLSWRPCLFMLFNSSHITNRGSYELMNSKQWRISLNTNLKRMLYFEAVSMCFSIFLRANEKGETRNSALENWLMMGWWLGSTRTVKL